MTNSLRILLQPTTWNDVYFRYQNGTLIGRVNNEIKTRPLIGKSSILLLSLAKWFSSSLLIYLLFFLILQSFTPNIEINSASSVLVFGLFFSVLCMCVCVFFVCFLFLVYVLFCFIWQFPKTVLNCFDGNRKLNLFMLIFNLKCISSIMHEFHQPNWICSWNLN